MITATLTILTHTFPGRAMVRMTEAARAIGMAGQTARNKLLVGKFPVKTVTQGRQRLVKLCDLAEYIDTLGTPGDVPSEETVAQEIQSQARRKRGRPTKAGERDAAR